MTDEMISDAELDEIFRTTIDAFIDQANLFADTNSKENVGLALLYAAARFNAYVVSQHAETLDDFERDLPKARDFFQQQYAEMLDENLADYRKQYTRYSHLVKKQ
jgi:ABC-type lipoprotein export system ATPase subunit